MPAPHPPAPCPPAPCPQDAFLSLDDDGEPYSIYYGRCFSRNILFLIEQAMRIAGEAEGAPGRCRQKSCRKDGRCHFRMNRDGDGFCGAGITPGMKDKAVLMLHFLCHVGRTARRETAERGQRRAST